MERLVGLGEAARATGKLSSIHTAGGHRRYDLAKLKPELFHAASQAERSTIAYARVSSHDQKDELERQIYGAKSNSPNGSIRLHSS